MEIYRKAVHGGTVKGGSVGEIRIRCIRGTLNLLREFEKTKKYC